MIEQLQKIDQALIKLKVSIDCVESCNARIVAQNHADTLSKLLGELKLTLESTPADLNVVSTPNRLEE